MEETKSKTRATRSRRGSVDSPKEQPKEQPKETKKKTTRTRKLKDISENDSASRRDSVDDYDDSASSKSSGSVRSCKVVLRRENFNDIQNDDGRAVAHSTRNRRNSQLTEENIAAHVDTSRRSLRSASIASDGTESTITRSTRSRVANSQNTPKKDGNAARPATPSRRSSRLLSENEKAADSPKPTPSKRNLRSNSVASVDDISPPTSRTRTSSRLTESQSATPKSLKTKVSKIKAEPTTPRRLSTRINKSVIMTDVIDEEASENDESEKTVPSKVDTSKKVVDVPDNIEEELERMDSFIEEEEVDNDVSQPKTHAIEKSTKVVSSTMDNEKSESETMKPIIVEENVTMHAKAPSSDSVQSNTNDSPTVLISTSTAISPKAASPIQQKADTPTVEPAEPMETSMTEQVKSIATPKANASKIVERTKTPNTPKTTSPVVMTLGEAEPEVAVAVVNEEQAFSPAPNKSKSQHNTPVVKQAEEKMERNSSDDANQASSANVSLVQAHISNDFEPMETEITSPEVNKDDSLKEILKNYTPKSKSRASSAFTSMDVTALTYEENVVEPTPKVSKKTPERYSLNYTVPVTGFDQMEVSVLASENVKTPTPKAKAVDEVKSPLPRAKTPSKDSIEEPHSTNLARENSPSKNSKADTPKAKTSRVETPKANTSKIETPKANKSMVETSKSETPMPEIPKAETPKAKSQRAETPKANTSKVETPKAETPKAKTPRAETPKANTSKVETPKTVTPMAKSPKATTLKVNTPKVGTPKPTTPKSKPSPKKTPISEQSISLNMEIDKIIAGLETPIISKEVNSRFEIIADSLTPIVSKSLIDREIDQLSLNKSLLKPMPMEQSVNNKSTHEDNNAEQDEFVNNSVVNETKEESTINETQSEVETTLPPTENAPREKQVSFNVSSKPERKSVQILTPKVVKSQSTEKRVDTPYPPASALKAAASQLECDEGTAKPDENREIYLQKLKESWSKSVKRNDLSSESPKAIDKLGSEQNENAAPKKSVAARNNWAVSNDLIDSESELEETVAESSDEGSDEAESDEESGNSMFDDEAEEVEDYNSGDSMDEDERHEIEENQIEEKGVDLGTDDSTEEEMEEEEFDSEDGFIVDDDNAVESNLHSDDDEIIDRKSKTTNKRRSSRIILPSSSEESETENSNDGSSNDVVSISVQQAEAIVVLAGNPPQAEKMVEGKKFATTYLTTEDDETDGTQTTTSKSSAEKVESSEQSEKAVEAEPKVAELVPGEQEEERMQEDMLESTSNAESTTSAKPSTESVDSDSEEIEKPAITNTSKVDKNASHALLAELDVVENGAVNEKILTKKQRTSLPGIDRVSKLSKDTQTSRMSLGDLNPNSQVVRAGLVKTQQDKVKSVSKKATPNKKIEANKSIKVLDEANVEPVPVDGHDASDNMNASTSSTENISPNKAKKAALDVSSQEENNNQKDSAKKRKSQTTEIIPTHLDLTAEASGLAQDAVTPATGMNDNKNNKKNKSKRRFEEIDESDDQCERPKAKKLLKIINTASGQFIEEPMTPEKQNRHGFQVTPLTPINPNFRVEKRASVMDRINPNKRKSIYLNEEEAEEAGLLLPKPRWQINTQFEDEQPRKRARKLDVGSTEVVFRPAEPKTKGKANIAAELRQFRSNKMYRKGIPRQDARALLREKFKRNANYK